jgi:hypothetical protein
MNEIIKDYIRQTSCKIVVNKLQKVLTYVIHWQMDENHVGILFATLECAWEFDMEISCKEVACSCMWVSMYIWCCIQHKVFAAIIATCPLALKAIQIPWIASACYN